MPRQKKDRFCQLNLKADTFKPRGIELGGLEMVNLKLDELEAIYLCDYLDHDQTETAELMGISRGTVQRLLYSGRKKVVDFISHCKALHITGGEHIIPPEPGTGWKCRRPERGPGRERGRGRGRGRIE